MAKRIRFFSDLRDAQFFQDSGEADNDEEERRRFCADLRRLQQRNKCSNATCEDICSTFAKYISVDLNDFKMFDKEMRQEAGVSFLRLNGCPCDKHIYLPNDRRTTCPSCGKSRFDTKGLAWETFLYFPWKPRLAALLRTKRYREMIQHEYLRPRNPDMMTDVYDSPEWQRLMGAPTYPNDRTGWQVCIDGIPANAEGSKSVKPIVAMNLSISPTERGKHENMMMLAILPASIKDPHTKKYFDWMAEYELDDLFKNGKFIEYNRNANTAGLNLCLVCRCGRSQN